MSIFLWSAPAERSDDGAFHHRELRLSITNPKRRRRCALPAHSISKQRAVASNQFSPYDLHRRIPGFDEAIVKILQRKRAAHLVFVVFAQLQYFQLPERVHQIRWIA